MPDINLLSQGTIDKIAAGEVVERPLSVVKELTENAIDAGASAVTVEIREGGISLIRVTDNGCGIHRSQIRKAFLRHATSKISSIEDLEHVSSLGFRGEALSSIAAVSQVEVISKTEGELTGIRYAIAGGREEELQEVGAPEGTTFLVRNLFFNTPARRKFLKQPQTEGGYVSDMMEHLALSRPDISLKFVNNGQVRFHTSGNGNLKEVIYRIYGRETSEMLLPFEAEGEDIKVSGFLGKPELNRSNRNFETYFVNGRYVKNDILTKAMEEGYRSYVMQHRFPFFVLHFSMQPESIDVNVHPAKMEIRIHNGQEVYQWISQAVQKAFGGTELIPSIKLERERKDIKAPLKTPEPFEMNRIRSQQEAELYESGEVNGAVLREEKSAYRTAAVQQETDTESELARLLQKIPQNKILGNVNNDKTQENEGIHANIIKAGEQVLVEKPAQLTLFEENFLSEQAREEYRILGQIFETYWLITFQDKLFIMDQHAAHEKVKYERLIKDLEDKQVTSQLLNPPVILNLTGREEDVLLAFLDHFTGLGFEIEEFGTGSYALRSMPADLYGCNEKELFNELLDELAENPMREKPEVILQKLASMACKAAVKGNYHMDEQEVRALLDQLLSLDNPYHCPHGRPTLVSMSKYEIEKKFKRIV